MARKAKAAAPAREPMGKVSLALLQRRVVNLEKALASTQEALEEERGERGPRAESDAEEALEKLRDMVRLALPALRKGLGEESLEDSLAKYEAHRALDDLSDEV